MHLHSSVNASTTGALGYTWLLGYLATYIICGSNTCGYSQHKQQQPNNNNNNNNYYYYNYYNNYNYYFNKNNKNNTHRQQTQTKADSTTALTDCEQTALSAAVRADEQHKIVCLPVRSNNRAHRFFRPRITTIAEIVKKKLF
jgi:hypothetical protein